MTVRGLNRYVGMALLTVALGCDHRFQFDVPDSLSTGGSAGQLDVVNAGSSVEAGVGGTTTGPGGAIAQAGLSALISGGSGGMISAAGGVTLQRGTGGTTGGSVQLPNAAGTAGDPACPAACVGAGLLCSNDALCVECNLDSDCRGSRTRCGAGNLAHRCVECRSIDDAACPSGSKCDVSSGRCFPACHLEGGGELDDHYCPSGVTCNSATGFCATCSYDSQCVGSVDGAHCHASSMQCVGCTSDMNCMTSRTYCDPVLLVCVACRVGRDCVSGVCDAATHQCR